MENNKKCNTLILSDEPALIDEFQAHSRLADTIVDIIHKEENGKSIALTGQWGSGKSTVISLVKEKLGKDNQNNIQVLEFDAWEHEGNSLRRSFLESILDSLEKIKWVNPKDWVKTRNKLSKKIKETETKSFPIIPAFPTICNDKSDLTLEA